MKSETTDQCVYIWTLYTGLKSFLYKKDKC